MEPGEGTVVVEMRGEPRVLVPAPPDREEEEEEGQEAMGVGFADEDVGYGGDADDEGEVEEELEPGGLSVSSVVDPELEIGHGSLYAEKFRGGEDSLRPSRIVGLPLFEDPHLRAPDVSPRRLPQE